MSEETTATPIGALLTPQIIEEIRKLFPRKPLNPSIEQNKLWLIEGQCTVAEILQEKLDSHNKTNETLPEVL